ncbi:MAG TPA: threonine synthase [Fimbriimonadaceae bacterium]|nr:threonine synthase [Fimbriimonadaceae bacterium]
MVTHLSCWLCGKEYPADRLTNLCECGRPLQVHYDFAPFPREALRDREATMWRYREMLPACEPVCLGEGWTPLFHAPRLGPNWYVKDEGLNPTGSFKARGMAAAVSMARRFGVTQVAAPSAGNAAGAMAAYAAAAGIEAVAYLPADTPKAFVEECRFYGARVHLVDGLITDCGLKVKELVETSGGAVFDLSTLKEPYRVEGKKTMGYEIAEQMDWELPNAVIYPTGGGTGLVGMWKAFDEMERLGWIGPKRPKMISVQAAGCAPIATAFAKGERFAEEFPNARTAASGLRVPKAVGDFIMLDLIRQSGGTALTVSDEEMVEGQKRMASSTGVFPAPEGGATLAAAEKLLERGFLKPSDTVVLFNTGSGLKYIV